MLLLPPKPGATLFKDCWSDPPGVTAGTSGVSVTPSITNYGSWTDLISALAEEAVAIALRVSGFGSSNKSSGYVEIGIDPAGGTSYSALISDILAMPCAPDTQDNGGAGFRFLFPIRIPAGASIGVRVLADHADEGLRINARVYGKRSSGWSLPVATYADAIGNAKSGTGTGLNVGTLFTPGNAAWGSWTSLGSTSKPYWWWQLGLGNQSTTFQSVHTYIELAIGDASNKQTIMQELASSTSLLRGFVHNANLDLFHAYFPAPSGVNVYVRGMCNTAPQANFYSASVIALGG